MTDVSGAAGNVLAAQAALPASGEPSAPGLAALAAAAGLPALPSAEELLGRLRAQDPQMAMVFDVIAAQRAQTTVLQESDDDPDSAAFGDELDAPESGYATVDPQEVAALARL